MDERALGLELKRWEIPHSDNRMIVVRRVLLNEKQYVEVRKWNKWRQDDQFHPTKNGIFIGADFLECEVLPAIIEAASHNSSHNDGDSSTVE